MCRVSDDILVLVIVITPFVLHAIIMNYYMLLLYSVQFKCSKVEYAWFCYGLPEGKIIFNAFVGQQNTAGLTCSDVRYSWQRLDARIEKLHTCALA